MSDAPERIWTGYDHPNDNVWFSEPHEFVDDEYVRADLYEAQARKIERIEAAYESLEFTETRLDRRVAAQAAEIANLRGAFVPLVGQMHKQAERIAELENALQGMLDHVLDQEFCLCEYKDNTYPADSGEEVETARTALKGTPNDG